MFESHITETKDNLFITYRFSGSKGSLPVTLKAFTFEIRTPRSVRRASDATIEVPVTGGLRFLKKDIPIEITIHEVQFIEKVNGQDGRIFNVIDVHDDSMLYGKKPKAK